jgi:hypothetical protein
MERDPAPSPTELTGIHINLADQAIEFEDRHGTIGRLVFGQEVVLYEGQPLLLAPRGDPRHDDISAEHPARSQRRPRRVSAPKPSPTPSPPEPPAQA